MNNIKPMFGYTFFDYLAYWHWIFSRLRAFFSFLLIEENGIFHDTLARYIGNYEVLYQF
jgi:hypothetical protein